MPGLDPDIDPTQYALVYGLRRTRATLAAWRDDRWRVVGYWFAGSFAAAAVLLLAVWGVATVASPSHYVSLIHPPIRVGGLGDIFRILGYNMLVLTLHAMACVAGFIAGSSLPLQAQRHTGFRRGIHEHGGRFAIAFVIGATTFSLSVQSLRLGFTASSVAQQLNVSDGLLLLSLLPHAIPELMALFLPLAAWIIASRRGEWDQLLAATFVTVAIAVPMLICSALFEVYLAPHVTSALLSTSPGLCQC